MRIFVTGATGVIGSRVVPVLAEAGHAVTALARSPEKRHRLERLGVATVEASLFSLPSLRAALAGHDVVINLATHVPPTSLQMLLPGAWRENDKIRRLGSANLVSASLGSGVRRFIQESFAFAYPDRGSSWIDETVPLEPARYNRSVLAAERSAHDFTRAGGTGVVLRFAMFYGPDSEFTRELFQSVERGFVPLFGRPDGFISLVSHDDAATAVLAALDAPAGDYNVVDDCPLTRRELVDSIARAIGVRRPRLPPSWMTAVGGSVVRTLARSVRVSNRKLRAVCGWTPKYPTTIEAWPQIVAALREAEPVPFRYETGGARVAGPPPSPRAPNAPGARAPHAEPPRRSPEPRT